MNSFFSPTNRTKKAKLQRVELLNYRRKKKNNQRDIFQECMERKEKYICLKQCKINNTQEENR